MRKKNAGSTPAGSAPVSFRTSVASSMITMLLQSAYSVVDGLFVSNLVGDTALAAVNVAWPIIAVITAAGTGIGAGGASYMSIKQGEQKWEESNRVRANTILALFAAGAVITVCFLLFLTPLLKLMGASGNLLTAAEQYGRIMIAGGVIQVLSCGLAPIFRNENRQVGAMTIMVLGFLFNLTMDFVLLYFFHLGIGGAALASLGAQLLTTALCFLTLFGVTDRLRARLGLPGSAGTSLCPLRREQFVFEKDCWKRIFSIGISPFGISLTPSLLILYHNIACLNYGDLAVSAYALISSTIGSYRILLIGVAEGMQPLASKAYGASQNGNATPAERIAAYDEIRHIRNKAIRTAIAASVLLFLFTIATASFYPALYGYQGDAAAAGYHAVMLTAAQLIFTGIVRVTNSFFYAVGKNRYSLFMIYFDPLCLTPAALAVLPHFFGTDGIWLTAVITQFLLNLVAAGMFVRHNAQMKREQAALTKGV